MGSRRALPLAIILVLVIALPCGAKATPSPTAIDLSMAVGTSSLSSGASVSSGTVVTFTARANSGPTKLTQGQVTLCDASAVSCTDIHQFGTAQLTKAGSARFRFVPGIGSHRYKAVFAGTPGTSPAYAASNSATVTLVVNGPAAKANTATTLTVSGDAGQYSMAATVVGTANRPGLAAPTGSVSFLNTTTGTVVLGTSTVGPASSGVSFLRSDTPPFTALSDAMPAADFNGDGFPDLVGQSVFFGNGDGTFTPGPALPTVGQQITSIVVGDYNGDGIPDLAVAHFDNYSITILLGNGDGTFTAVSRSIPLAVQEMVTGDFNGDGIADLATAQGYSVSIFLGNGDGTFTAAGKNSWPGVDPLYLATGDFNGDGLTDIAVSDTAVRGSIFLLINKGDGTFSKTSLSPATGFVLGGIAAGDLNGDGFLDLALASYSNEGSGSDLTVLLGNGDGSFQAPKLYGSTYLGQGSVGIGDFNGDAIPDVVTGQDFNGSISILLGKGDGTFGNAILAPTDTYPFGYPTVADFNGDGISDMAAAGGNGSFDLLLAQPTESVTATVPSVVLTQPGTYQFSARYSGDDFYQSSSSPATGLFYHLAPTVTVTPSAATVESPNPLTVAVVVEGAKGYSTPTGLVNLTTATLYSSGYVSDYVSLSHGSATITVPTSVLHPGTNMLTVNYLPDAASQSIYQGQTGSATVVVTLPPVAGAPQFSLPPGTYSLPQNATLTDTTPTSTMYYTLDGSDPTTASAVYNGPIAVAATETIKAFAMADGYSASPISAASYTIGAPNSQTDLTSLSPAFISAGNKAFTLTVNGSGFSGNPVVFWGKTALTTQFVNGNQLVAQVSASDAASAGIVPITVQTSVSGGAVSNALQFEMDSMTPGSTTSPVFGDTAATIAAGSTATYPVSLPSTASNVSASCLNLPTGATCSYSATSGTVVINTLSTTPKGTYTVTVVFTETVSGVMATAVLPVLLIPFVCRPRKISSRRLCFAVLMGVLLLVPAACISACGGSSGSTQTPPVETQQLTSSATVGLTVQ